MDVHSFARPEEVIMNHLDLDIKVDFDKKVISGKASIGIDNKTGADSIHLDTQDLTIEKVTLDNEQATQFTLGKKVKHLGSDLAIAIKPETKTVTIHYQSSPQAEALQWLNPQQTAGKKYPFLFTQSQAILARSWVPCQDSPGIRFTYTATVQVPKDLLALMSASNPTEKNATGSYQFKMEQKIPAYLLALSVGDVAFKSLGKRTGVYAEPATLEKATYEFGETEQMLESAEKLYGAYAWDRYDLLVLPPSFPFGGMENPRLTFATPTILAGDRSLTSLVAHELAHSWSGNLVTNMTWNDFWLNEGFTVYFERRIMEALYGKSYADMLALLGYQDLMETVEELGKTSDDTKLKLNLEGRSPDDGVSDIAYEKGYFLLRLIEENVGRERWDAFVKGYFKTYAFRSMNTEDFLIYLQDKLLKNDKALIDKIGLEKWVYQPGIPDNCPKVVSERFIAVEKQAAAFEKGQSSKTLVTKGWSSHEWLHFVRNLPTKLSLTQMTDLDQAFHFTQSGNSEVLSAWLLHVVNNQYAPGYLALETFLVQVGRRKFLIPLYKALLQTPEGKQRAKDIYQKARPNYHYVAVSTIDEMMK